MNKVFFVTGATRGLGLGVADALEQQKHIVIRTGRGNGTLPLDVTDESQIDRAIETVMREHGRIDVLINNAGVLLDRKGGAAKDVFLKTFDANVVGPYLLCQKILPIMRAQKFGRIVNVSSEMGRFDWMNTDWPAYRASKAALNAVTCMFAAQVQPDEDILVNSVSPGWVRTEMGGEGATRDIPEGVASILWAAFIPKGGPNGGFFIDGKKIPF